MKIGTNIKLVVQIVIIILLVFVYIFYVDFMNAERKDAERLKRHIRPEFDSAYMQKIDSLIKDK